MKIANLRLEELLHGVDVAVKAALTVPELRTALHLHSMDDKKMQAGLELVKEIRSWKDWQADAQAQAQRAQRTFKDVQRSIRALNRSHREAARFAYRQDPDQRKKLQLTTLRAVGYAEWRNRTEKFYIHLDAKVMAKYGVPAAEIAEVKALMAKLLELEVLRNDARRQAQQATQRKRTAVRELRTWFSHFMRVARLACAEDPQLLEAMGIVVPS